MRRQPTRRPAHQVPPGRPEILELLTRYRPYRLTISVYGATTEAYEGLTRRRGSFEKFSCRLSAAHEAGLPLNLNLIVT